MIEHIKTVQNSINPSRMLVMSRNTIQNTTIHHKAKQYTTKHNTIEQDNTAQCNTKQHRHGQGRENVLKQDRTARGMTEQSRTLHYKSVHHAFTRAYAPLKTKRSKNNERTECY